MEPVVIAAFVATVGLAGWLVFHLWKQLRDARAAADRSSKESLRFQPIVDLQGEIERLTGSRTDAAQALAEVQRHMEIARGEIAELLATADLQAVGLYKRTFDFKDAAEYKRKLELLRDKQEAMVKAGLAAVCSQAWSISGSTKEGKRVSDKILKLMLRAFNGECDALIGRVRYDNFASFKLRIEKGFASINKLGDGFHCAVQENYLALKVAELAMVHEYQEQVQDEREEQRRIREMLREEEKRAQEIDKLRKEAEQDENRYETLLLRAQKESEAAEGDRRARLEAHIAELQESLRLAHEKAERAKSQAQLTRAGHVYVLSNVGSFGEHVYKVGMTRRLDPDERVAELGDASVPFCFDIHAMIYTEDAPKLERALHAIFDGRRVNRVNLRKEFFRATIDEIEDSVRKHHGEFRLTKLAEAIEYRKTLGIAEVQAPLLVKPNGRPDSAVADPMLDVADAAVAQRHAGS